MRKKKSFEEILDLTADVWQFITMTTLKFSRLNSIYFPLTIIQSNLTNNFSDPLTSHLSQLMEELIG